MPKPPKHIPQPKSPSTRRAIEHEKAIADALFLSIGEGAIVIDSAGKINRINQAALNILGYEREVGVVYGQLIKYGWHDSPQRQTERQNA